MTAGYWRHGQAMVRTRTDRRRMQPVQNPDAASYKGCWPASDQPGSTRITTWLFQDCLVLHGLPRAETSERRPLPVSHCVFASIVACWVMLGRDKATRQLPVVNCDDEQLVLSLAASCMLKIRVVNTCWTKNPGGSWPAAHGLSLAKMQPNCLNFPFWA